MRENEIIELRNEKDLKISNLEKNISELRIRNANQE
jgi:hypothetical protein